MEGVDLYLGTVMHLYIYIVVFFYIYTAEKRGSKKAFGPTTTTYARFGAV